MKRKGICPKAHGQLNKCSECQYMGDDCDGDEEWMTLWLNT